MIFTPIYINDSLIRDEITPPIIFYSHAQCSSSIVQLVIRECGLVALSESQIAKTERNIKVFT